MSRKDYIVLANIAGRTLGAAYVSGGEDARTVVYDALYRPLTSYLRDDNPAFDNLRFASAVGTAEAGLVESEIGEGPHS